MTRTDCKLAWVALLAQRFKTFGTDTEAVWATLVLAELASDDGALVDAAVRGDIQDFFEKLL
jgi:hypothetical protein